MCFPNKHLNFRFVTLQNFINRSQQASKQIKIFKEITFLILSLTNCFPTTWNDRRNIVTLQCIRKNYLFIGQPMYRIFYNLGMSCSLNSNFSFPSRTLRTQIKTITINFHFYHCLHYDITTPGRFCCYYDFFDQRNHTPLMKQAPRAHYQRTE